MQEIIIKNYQNKEFEIFRFLRVETESLIASNIIEINRKMNLDIQIESYSPEQIVTLTYWGYVNAQGLYDKLILKHNEQFPSHLKRWI